MELDNHTTAAGATAGHGTHAGLLDDLMARVAPCSARQETRLTCRDMVNGLLAELEDYNCWTLAEAAGHPSPYRMQHPLSRARCDEQLLLDSAAGWAAAYLTAGQDENDVVLIVDLCRHRHRSTYNDPGTMPRRGWGDSKDYAVVGFS